jgi:hypothetical protein
MTVTQQNFGVIKDGQTVFASTVTAGTKVVRQLGGVPGEAGVYVVDTAQTVASITMESRFV